MPARQSDMQSLQDNIVDFGMPGVPVGQIRRLSQTLRKGSPEAAALRKVMSAENKARGAASEGDYLDTLLRSTPFHGRSYEHYPDVGEVYNPGIAKPGNVGEPQGLSLTYREPSKFVREHTSFAKRPKKYRNAANALSKKADQIGAPEVVELDHQLNALSKQRSALRMELNKDSATTFGGESSEELNKLDAKIDNLLSTRDELARNSKGALLHRQATKYAEKQNDPAPISRVFPRFHGRPSEKIVKGWKGSGDEKVLQDAYTYALQQMPELWTVGRNYTSDIVRNKFPSLSIDQAPRVANLANDLSTNPNAVEALSSVFEHIKSGTSISYEAMGPIFDILPVRYSKALEMASKGEELPKNLVKSYQRLEDVYNLVKSDFDTLPKTSARLASYANVKEMLYGQNRTTFNTHLTDYMRSKGYRGVLYSPQRYGEYELRMLDPRDVVQQDIRQVDDPALERMYGEKSKLKYPYDHLGKESNKKSKVIQEWEQRADLEANPDQLHGHTPYALGAVYKDIALDRLELPPEHLRRSAAEEVKTRLMAEEQATLQDGLSVGKLGDVRVRKDDVPMFNTPDSVVKMPEYPAGGKFPWEEDDIVEPLNKSISASDAGQEFSDLHNIYGNIEEAAQHMEKKYGKPPGYYDAFIEAEQDAPMSLSFKTKKKKKINLNTSDLNSGIVN